MSKIQVAYIIDKFDIGGTERQLKLLIEGLDRSRFDVSLFLLRGNGSGTFKRTDVSTYVLDVHSLVSLNGFKKVFQLSQTLKKIGCQIVQTFFQDSTILGVLAAKMAGTEKIVISIRDMLFWATPWNLALYRFVARLADSVLVNSFAVKKHVSPLFKGKRVDVIYNGISVGAHYKACHAAKRRLMDEFGFNNDMPVVVMVSNCNRMVKRVDLLVESIPLIVKETPAFFLIIGDGHLRPTLEKRVKELNIQAFVKFTGQRNDVEDILAGSDIAVNASISEGLSNSIMEAMRAGLPVVASDIAGNRELLGHGVVGSFFPPGDFQNLAAEISKLLRNRNLAVRMGEAGSKIIESNFSVEKMLKEHRLFYESLLLKI